MAPWFDGASSGGKFAQNIIPRKRMTSRHILTVPSNVWGVLKKSVPEVVNFGDQAGLVCWRNQQAISQL